jgi:hypothetical protein
MKIKVMMWAAQGQIEVCVAGTGITVDSRIANSVLE